MRHELGVLELSASPREALSTLPDSWQDAANAAGGNTTRVVSYFRTSVSVIAGPDLGKGRDAVRKALRIGTAADNDLVLEDETVSRYHCEIVPTAEGIVVRDSGSTNGTLAGSLRLREGTFAQKFQLRLGTTVLEVTPQVVEVEQEQSTGSRFGDLLGESECMRELFADLARIAPTSVSVLIEGETGTGKELVAESIHRASPRAGKPYVVFDCSAIAPSLIESELFGHERGAFTGAVASRAGVFEQANGGTIFLDEVGELPKELQPKLLRVLEKREVRRIGSNKTVSVDVRLLSATNRNLITEVERGAFREDVYFRIVAAHVYVPPLRDRLDDLPILVGHFLNRANPPAAIEAVSEEVWKMFRSHNWPGNVRELQNAVQRMQLTPNRTLSSPRRSAFPEALEAPAEPQAGELESLRVARRDASTEFERSYLKRLLALTDGNVRRGAAIAEVSRQMIQKLLRKHGM